MTYRHALLIAIYAGGIQLNCLFVSKAWHVFFAI